MIDALRRHVLHHLDGVRPSGDGYMARCPMPGHDDNKASLSIQPGKNQPVVMYCHGCQATPREIADAAGIPWAAVCNEQPRRERDPWAWMRCVKESGHQWRNNYIYQDQHGDPVLGVARCDSKCFAQFRPDPSQKMGRSWRLTLPDGSKAGAGIPYRLPDLLKTAGLIYIVEGEKDADRLWSMDLPATCNAGGAGKWTQGHASWLRERDVIIVADRDEPGRKHAMQVTATLMDVAGSIEIAQAISGKDVSDHLDASGTLASLARVATPKPFLVGASR